VTTTATWRTSRPTQSHCSTGVRRGVGLQREGCRSELDGSSIHSGLEAQEIRIWFGRCVSLTSTHAQRPYSHSLRETTIRQVSSAWHTRYRVPRHNRTCALLVGSAPAAVATLGGASSIFSRLTVHTSHRTAFVRSQSQCDERLCFEWLVHILYRSRDHMRRAISLLLRMLTVESCGCRCVRSLLCCVASLVPSFDSNRLACRTHRLHREL
jgi:hypothetical protein